MIALLFGSTACAQASANSAGVWVRVSPTTVTAGNQTQIQASCGENANAATVQSPAFGTVALQPVNGVLGAMVTIPASTPRGTFDVRLDCRTGSHAVTTLTVLNTAKVPSQGQTMRGPGTGGGFLANGGGEPANRTPMIWLGAGLACLLVAAAVMLRTKRPLVAARIGSLVRRTGPVRGPTQTVRPVPTARTRMPRRRTGAGSR
jgi:hypothetical protein